jgi:hypothetical protein
MVEIANADRRDNNHIIIYNRNRSSQRAKIDTPRDKSRMAQKKHKRVQMSICGRQRRKTIMKNLTLSCFIIIVSLAGCSYVYDFWPANIPQDTKTYADIDPNSNFWPGIGTLKELREKCITKNITTQSELIQQMNLDKALYGRAIDQANINIEHAELERQQIVGTIQNPGWLLSFLLPATGAFAGRAITKLTHYSEQELKAELEKRTPAQPTTQT